MLVRHYSVLGGRKPILEASPSTSDDLTAKGAYSYTPGGPGSIAGMARFVAEQLPDVHRVAVLYADNPAGKASAEQFLKPQLQKLGVNDVKLVGVADTATGPDVATAIQAAGGLEADTLLSFLTVPGCIATYDALQSLGIKPRVVATGLCFGTPMTKHMRDVGSKDQVAVQAGSKIHEGGLAALRAAGGRLLPGGEEAAIVQAYSQGLRRTTTSLT